MEFMEILGFDHSLLRPDKLQNCLAVRKNTNKHTLEHAGGEKSL